MKVLATTILVTALVGCGVKAEDNRDKLSKTQRAKIEQRITSYSVLNTPNEGLMQVAMNDTLPGQAKYATCSACHGAQGQGGVGPMLAGQTVDYIVDRLRTYKAGETIGSQSNLMWGQAAMLTEDDMADLAEYINTL